MFSSFIPEDVFVDISKRRIELCTVKLRIISYLFFVQFFIVYGANHNLKINYRNNNKKYTIFVSMNCLKLLKNLMKIFHNLSH